MRKYIVLYCVLLLISNIYNNALAQTNPFKMVHLSKVVEKQLYNYLITAGEIDSSDNTLLLRYELNGKDVRKKYRFVNGIYLFKVNGAHFKPYLFFKNNNGIEIIDNYNKSQLLKRVKIYMKQENVSHKEQSKYIDALMEVLKSRDNII
jgi:hypothetical protein